MLVDDKVAEEGAGGGIAIHGISGNAIDCESGGCLCTDVDIRCEVSVGVGKSA